MNKRMTLATALAVGAMALTGCTSQADTEAAAATSSAAAASSAAASSSAAAAATSSRVAAAVEASKLRAAEEERKRIAAEEANRINAAKMDRGTYEQISDRDFAMLVKNPDTAKGRKLVIYGYVSQFDSATGTNTFRAETGANPQDRYYNYDQNTIVTGLTPTFADVVEDDMVTMYVEVLGSYSYDTQMGGNTTVPKFFANIIDVTGSKS